MRHLGQGLKEEQTSVRKARSIPLRVRQVSPLPAGRGEHVRAYQSRSIERPAEEVAGALVEQVLKTLSEAVSQSNWKVHAYVLMNTHVICC